MREKDVGYLRKEKTYKCGNEDEDTKATETRVKKKKKT